MTLRNMRLEAICKLYDKRNERIAGAIGRGVLTLADVGILLLTTNYVQNETIRIIGISLAGIRGLRNAGGFVLNTGMAIYDTIELNKALK